MENENSAEQFLEAQFKKQHFPVKAIKEFVAVGFLSAYTQLLTNEEEIRQEKTIVEQLSTWEYFQQLIVCNQQKMNDDFVQSLSEYIQLLHRKRLYRYSTPQTTRDGKVTFPPVSAQAVIASLELGIELYQKKYLVMTNP